MPACPSGTHVKPSVTQDSIWVEAAELCNQVSWVAGWMGPVCQQLLPRLVDIEDLCATEPPPIPDIDLEAMALAGQLNFLPQRVADWVWANWINLNWNTYCECTPGSGTGPCPPIPLFGGTVSANFNGGHVLAGRQPLPTGFSGGTITRSRGADGQAGNMFVAYLLEDAAQHGLQYSQAQTEIGLLSGQTSAPSSLSIYSTASIAAARYVSLWTRSSGVAPQDPATFYTYLVQLSGTLTGTCTDVPIPFPPPTPQPEPPIPTAPPMPTGPTGCTPDEICRQLYNVLLQLRATGGLVTLLQRYGTPFSYVLGPSHPNLSGSGTLFPPGCVGMRVDITSPLPSRQLEGNPPYLWDLGWMSIMTGEGMIEERRITRDTQIWQPRLMQEATTFGYFLKDGVTATFTELQPEPY